MTSKALVEPTASYRDEQVHLQQRAAVRRGRRTLALLAFVCVLPVAASYLLYYLWRPSDTVNHGELVQPMPLPSVALEGAAGQPALSSDELLGQWTLVTVGPGACEARCASALYSLRQSRLAQGKEMQRVSRLWLITDGVEPAAATLAGHDGLRVARASPDWLAQLPGEDASGAVWLVDPLGNVMLRYAAGTDPKGVIKDLQRLLKYSPLGRPQ